METNPEWAELLMKLWRGRATFRAGKARQNTAKTDWVAKNIRQLLPGLLVYLVTGWFLLCVISLIFCSTLHLANGRKLRLRCATNKRIPRSALLVLPQTVSAPNICFFCVLSPTCLILNGLDIHESHLNFLTLFAVPS